MGLDIDLIRIVNHHTDDLRFLPEDENPELESQFGHLKISRTVNYGNGPETVAGYYYEDLSYQRKGIKKEFYDRYQPDEFILTKKELDELVDFVDDDHKNSFRTEFVDKFIEGETVVLMGY